MKSRRSSRMTGFTLLEVLVSTVLLASVYVAVFALSSQSLRNLTRLQPHEKAMTHAREKLNQVLLLEALEPATSSGTWEDGYRWKVRISSNVYTPHINPNSFGLFDIHVAIFWGDSSSEKSYVLETTQWAKRVNSNAGH